MTGEAPGAGRRLWHGFHRVRRRFRRWRRGRPFWGGVFLILGGVQLFLSTQLSPMDVEISFGPQGFLAIILPLALLLCGLLLWVTPQHRYFYSVIGTVTAVYSLLGLNLGGWFLGMLLGIIGGALGFSWTPVQPAALPPQPDPAATSGPLTDQPPDQQPTAPFRARRPDPRRFATLAGPLLLTAALSAPGVAAAPAAPADHCLIPLPVLCSHPPEPAASPEPTPDPSQSTTPSPGPTGTPNPAPTPGPTGEPAPTPPGSTPSPGPTPTVGPTPAPTAIPTGDPQPDQPLVSAEPARMTADRLTQQDFRFEGITELPTKGEPIEVLHFSFSRSVAENFTLAPTHDGQTTLVTADPLVISGDVAFYTSRFEGRLFGTLPLALTPDSPLVDLLELVDIPLLVVFTDVDLDLVFTSGAELTATGFSHSLP